MNDQITTGEREITASRIFAIERSSIEGSIASNLMMEEVQVGL